MGEYKDVLLNKKVSNIQWTEFNAKIIEKELLKSTRFLCLALMTKFISKTMGMMD